MPLTPLEQARSAAKLLQLREQLQSGTLNPIAQVRVTAEALALYTALGGAPMDGAKPVDAEQAAEFAADDGLSDDPNAENYRYKDTGYIAGSRKEEATELIRGARESGTMLRASDIDFTAIEANPREAKKLITKSNLFGVVDWSALQAGGMEPAAGFLLDRAYAAVGKEPGENTPEARKSFVLGLETLRTRMESCKTSKDVLAVMDEIREELMGAKLNADEADQYKALGQQSHDLALKAKAIRDDQNVFYNAMSLASSTARTAKYDIEKRLSRGWKLTGEHEKAVTDAEAESRKATEAWRANLEQNRDSLDAMDSQRQALNKQQREIVDIAKVRNLKSPETQAWLSLGERFIKATMFRSRAGSSTFRDHAANALAGEPKTWEWAEKDVATVEKKVTQKRRTFALKVIDVFERKGGRTVPINSTKDLETLCGFRAVQTGNWVQKDIDSAKWHVEQAAGAMMDMADMLGISEKALGFGGRLGMAFGARGTGNAGGATAKGHYEPIHRVINITKMNGGGSLGHECWHAVDNILHSVLRGEEGGAEDFASANPSLMPEGPIRDAFTALKKSISEGDHRLPELIKFTDKNRANARHNIDSPHNEVSRKIKAAGSAEAAVLAVDAHFSGIDSERLLKLKKQWRTLAAAYYAPEGTNDIQLNTGRGVSKFMAEAKLLDGAKSKEYWSSHDELSARAFQSYLEDKLAEKDRQNDYLSSLADNKHHYFPALGEPFKPYPEGEERTRINAAFDQVFQALRDEKAFEKALENTALLDSIFGAHDD
jgi:23S rRNA pseudoU1915 N3-methylase RlmH